jgi:hypothetical protein
VGQHDPLRSRFHGTHVTYAGRSVCKG